ncbi:tripartite tricarboxylate transporter permease [Afifella sp. IM 167]|uniref:tripartite tricarboxylate transporter permease n=1 Tax=Afifella sp. IM 167 TaxID=2033586 RepID=UPI001CC91C61|nr:tripartite tricarboxylate transporter permease [Afifella sp. IM 167]MBZ8132715.1 C4-dicarboxylate ABC transporter permease [Afifella sp. IM 167]
MDVLDLIGAVTGYFGAIGSGLWAGAHLFFTLSNLLAVFGGVAIGCLFGALPGLSITLSVALVMPFTFNMDPLTGLSLLTAVYVGAIYGGSISAILFNTPGTPAAACTTLDGYALTQKGQAGKALHMANWASMVGDLTSTILVILAFPLLAKVAIYFRSPEYFALIVFSITVVGGVAGRSMLLGLIAGILGFLFSTVGMDPVQGYGRFDFGSLELLSGFSFVPLLIGLFAVPEFMRQFVRSGRSDASVAIAAETGAGDDNHLTWREFKASFRHMVRGGVIGLILGVIPGLGATPAAFLSYEQARRNSRHPEEFGHGSLEGIAAAEAGNNGVNGATLAPLLTLGIPGDVVTAVMLGALLIFNLQPGPMLFVTHADLIYGLFCALLVCDVALRIVGIAFIRVGRYVTRVPTGYVFPLILVLCVFGTYSINNNIFDVFVMLSFGIGGLVMERVRLPVVPFVIAFVLGPMLEKGLRRSLVISDGDPMIFLHSPIAVGFFILTILAIVTIVRSRLAPPNSSKA